MRRSFLLIVIFLSVLIVSCNRHHNGSDPLWKTQLDSLIVATKHEKVSLESYNFRKQLSSENDYESMLEEIFNDKAIVAWGSVDNPKMIRMGELLIPGNNGDASFKMDEYLKTGTGLVDTKWSFAGENYHSVAVVSDEGVVYDNIGWYLVRHNSATTKSKADTTGVSGGSVDFSLSDYSTNIVGTTLYSYVIWCTSSFNSEGILTSYDMSASSEQHLGWGCDASVVHVSGEPYSTPYHVFSWAYIYGFGSPVSISYNGLNFSFTGSGHKANGTETHVAPSVADSLVVH